jgi:hypothetical protein
MNNQQFERLVENLQDIMRCPHCSASYGLQDIHYLGQLDSMTFLHMRCSSCHTPVFASVALANTNGEIIPSDLTVDDIALTNMANSQMEDDLIDLGFERKGLDNSTNESVQVPIEDISAESILHSLSPVAYDDVLDMHQYLNSCSGDFDTIFTK